jgi:RNA polymerase sigma-70 factor, ECF subfamily
MSTSTQRAGVDGIGAQVVIEPPRAFDDFFQRCHPRLFAALCLTTGDRHEADEIAQEAFLRVLERWDRVAAMDDPTGFLFTTAMNVFRKRYRRAQLAARLPIPRPVPEDVFATIDNRDVLVRAMRGLTPQQRAAIVMTAILDVSSGEAAQVLGIKDSTVRVLAGKARAQLRASVGDER